MKSHWDIFCKVVDNYGDIGVCWRLARQLQAEHGIQLRLFVDDLNTAQRIIPGLNPGLETQTIAQIEICQWPHNPISMRSLAVVIEAFGCGLPEDYLAQLSPQTMWLNLEYLSAENWVESFHGKSSVFATDKPKRYFFYPGFSAKTGGLIRENNASGSRMDIGLQGMLLEKFPLNISLFCYAHAPVESLLKALSEHVQKSVLYLSDVRLYKQLQHFFNKDEIAVNDILTRANLTVKVLPFLSQPDYDALLAYCDLNFVRGEDSWVRAIWAGKPFIWQPYQQTENTHLKKLDAFIALFYADFLQKDMLQKAHMDWATGNMPDISPLLSGLSAWQSHAQLQQRDFAKLPDLASNLVKFCHDHSR